jgi:hypothetical protein
LKPLRARGELALRDIWIGHGFIKSSVKTQTTTWRYTSPSTNSIHRKGRTHVARACKSMQEEKEWPTERKLE